MKVFAMALAGTIALGFLSGDSISQDEGKDTKVWAKKFKITFASARDGNPEIYTMDADGSNQKNLTNNQAYDWSPVWSR